MRPLVDVPRFAMWVVAQAMVKARATSPRPAGPRCLPVITTNNRPRPALTERDERTIRTSPLSLWNHLSHVWPLNIRSMKLTKSTQSTDPRSRGGHDDPTDEQLLEPAM
jgi:hypothetical protein